MTGKGKKGTSTGEYQHLSLDVFKEALENATDAIGMSTPQGRHYYQNKAFSDLFGDVGENPPATLYCDEQVGTAVFRTIMAGGTWTGEVAMYARDGSVLDILLRAYAITSEQGRVIGLVGIHTDITERRRAEEAIKLSEATYREIFNTANDTIWIHDIDTYDFIDVNNKVTEMFGYSVAEALNLGVEALSSGDPPFTQDEAVARMQKAAAGKPQIFEWHTRHKDGHLFWTEVSLKRGTIAGKDCLLAIERDITERKRAEETLRRIHALESLGTIAGGIAHDFNNLLMGVFGNIELIKRKLPPDHAALSSLEAAHQALETARHLTTRLLTFAKGGQPVLETVDLRNHIRETVQFHLAGSKVAAHLDIPEDLWPVKADKGQIAEVISNLTINAKEAMPAGGTLIVSARNASGAQGQAARELDGDCIHLAFKDEGLGIPDDIVERIFDPYFSTKQKGHGLGLAIVHGIISRHNGRISVDSVPDAGTTISVFLPADTQEPCLPAACEPPAAEPPLPGSGHILIVDDEAVIRKTTAMMLEGLGCTIETAVDGLEAIEKYAEAMKQGRPFDLTIMDLTIPGSMGGQESVGELLALDPTAKVIVSSGYSSDPVLADYARYGFCGRLAKPFTFEELTAVVMQVLKAD